VGSSGGRGELESNLRGAAFPSALSTDFIGHVERIEAWFGLTGRVATAS
jgi:hypothetical protein